LGNSKETKHPKLNFYLRNTQLKISKCLKLYLELPRNDSMFNWSLGKIYCTSDNQMADK